MLLNHNVVVVVIVVVVVVVVVVGSVRREPCAYGFLPLGKVHR